MPLFNQGVFKNQIVARPVDVEAQRRAAAQGTSTQIVHLGVKTMYRPTLGPYEKFTYTIIAPASVKPRALLTRYGSGLTLAAIRTGTTNMRAFGSSTNGELVRWSIEGSYVPGGTSIYVDIRNMGDRPVEVFAVLEALINRP